VLSTRYQASFLIAASLAFHIEAPASNHACHATSHEINSVRVKSKVKARFGTNLIIVLMATDIRSATTNAV